MRFFLNSQYKINVNFLSRRTDSYLKSLNKASDLTKAIAERKTVPQLGESLIGFDYTLKTIFSLRIRSYLKALLRLNVVSTILQWDSGFITFSQIALSKLLCLLFLRWRPWTRGETVLWKRWRSYWFQTESWPKKSHRTFRKILFQFNSRTARFANNFFNV